MRSGAFDIQGIIERLERRRLDGAQPPAVPIWGQLDATCFIRVDGLAAFWEEEEDCRFEQYVEDLVTGFHGQGLTFAYLILGRHDQVQVYMGLQSPQAEILLATALRGTFPAIELAEKPAEKLGSALRQTALLSHLGRLTGIPTLKAGRDHDREGSVQQIERLLRGLYGEEWGYLVLSRPIKDADVAQIAYKGFEQIREVSALVKKSVQIAPGTTSEQTDRQAQYCVELLEKHLERLNRGKAQGMWQVEVYFFAASEATLDKAKALLTSIFAGKDSVPDPLRTFKCSPAAPQVQGNPLATLLNSYEVSILTQLPREEMPGYAVQDYARFDVALPTEPVRPEQAINIGRILDGGAYTGNWYALPRHDFAKHGLVVGVTGSGKTNTLFHLLDKLWNKGQGVPFLVIEPAKAEYRDLRTALGFERLRIFTLGDERWAPFRLNPFEFEIADAENRIHVQTHIDFLKSVFNAAFILYAPMPYVLETCLHEIYQDKGWDLTTSQNRRLPPQERGNEAKWPVFPTLTDLYNKIDEVVDRLGYEERIQMDVKAGLKARIGSLRLGGKGLMLDVRHSVPMAELLSHPTVLELERIGNDDEKAFLIGLLLTRLYEYRVVQARMHDALPRLQHVTIFEEAHRLLKYVPTEVQTEEANVKGQAVETFANMLSEIRAYGQGVLIAEQIPAKLSPDAVKNTNLKIMHRIVAEDDREIMGGAMNLDKAQKRYVTTLRTGQAVVYAEGADKPYLIEVYNFKGMNVKGRVKDKQVRGAMQRFCSQPLYDPLPGYSQYMQSLQAGDARADSEIRDMALAVINHSEFAERFSRYFLSLIEEPRQAVYGYHDLVQLTERVVKPKPDQEKLVALYVMLQALTDLLEDRGRRYGWFYNTVETLRRDIAAILCDIVRDFENRQVVLDRLVAHHAAGLQTFSQGYKQLCAKAPIPYAGCAFCQARCLYRYEVARLVKDKALERDFVGAIQNTSDDQEMWVRLAQVCQEAARRAIQVENEAVIKAVALCYAAQMGPALGFSSASQRKMVKSVQNVLGVQ
ncbi:MAG TPA: ATP-binding protein [Anaerolineae bacterium]|nr:ATP-binding protein [Anaerolineae bacterium]